MQTSSPPPNASAIPEYSLFGIDESILSTLLGEALRRGGDYADLYFEHGRSSSIGLEDGIINRASSTGAWASVSSWVISRATPTASPSTSSP